MRISVRSGLVAVAFAVVLALGASEDDYKDKNTTTARPTTTLPTTTTLRPTTTLPTTTPDVTETTKTTTADNTTTAQSTTSAPTTTHAPTQRPTLPPEPKAFKWNVTDSNNNTCILLQAGIRMVFQYKNSTGHLIKNYELDVPDQIEATGACNKTTTKDSVQLIELNFWDGWKISIHFKLNASKYHIETVGWSYRIDKDHFNTNETGEVISDKSNINKFEVKVKEAYACGAHQSLYKINLNDTVGLAEIRTYGFKFEAFRNSTTQEFSSSVKHCPQDAVSQLVPIIVGATLAALIVIVLIAYLIGRRRSRRGYESV